jgi:hypothetical protein
MVGTRADSLLLPQGFSGFPHAVVVTRLVILEHLIRRLLRKILDVDQFFKIPSAASAKSSGVMASRCRRDEGKQESLPWFCGSTSQSGHSFRYQCFSERSESSSVLDLGDLHLDCRTIRPATKYHDRQTAQVTIRPC